MKNIGFIGCGNMAKAMIKGIVHSKVIDSNKISASSPNETELAKAKDDFGINVTPDNLEIVKKCDVIVLAVKPNMLQPVINEISPLVDDSKVIVAISPGKTLDDLEKMFGKNVGIVRTMPNTPAMVMEGMTALCKNVHVTDNDMDFIFSIMQSMGKAQIIKEELMNAVVAVSGSSPAYVYIFIEAMADAAVKCGMPRDMAYKFAAQSVYGSAKMVMETKLHPGILKDMVCSPGGTTIEAVKALEDGGFRSAIMNAMEVCAEKAEDM